MEIPEKFQFSRWFYYLVFINKIDRFLPKPLWNIPQKLNFGVLVQENKVITKTLVVENKGSQNGKFRITNISDLSIDIVPLFGVVQSYSHINLKVVLLRF